MDEFIDWYCSEPRLALNRGIVLGYRLQLEAKKLAASTINVRLAAVRRLAYEAADTGLLSPELVAGIRRVKGVPQLGRRVGNWLSATEGEQLLSGFVTQTLRNKRDLAIISLLLGCGLRRSEVVTLKVGDIQRREDHWAIIDLVGKAGMCELCRYLRGSKRQSTYGLRVLPSAPVSCSAQFARMEQFGETG